MSMTDIERIQNPDVLRAVAQVQDKEIRRLHEILLEQKRELALLKGASRDEADAQVALLEKTLSETTTHSYSTGSERRPKSKEPQGPKRRQKGHGPTAQPQLQIELVEHELDDADKLCSSCGGDLEEWKGQHETSEEIDVVELRYVLKKHVRKKYRCKCGGCVETALGPDKLIHGGRYSIDFAIQIAIDKYDGHLPLERQARRMRRWGLDVKSQTLWDQTFALANRFRDAVERLHKYLLSKETLLADETRWPLLGGKGRKTKNWYAWSLASDDAILHKILDSRSNEAAAELLGDFSGVLITDGYVVYKTQSGKLGFAQAHCWAHARRKFLEATSSAPVAANAFLDDIGELFAMERQADFEGRNLEPIAASKLRAQIRDERSRVILNRIGARAAEVKVLPRSPIAKAIKYLANRWAGLVRFVDDVRVPLTSNAVERGLRGLVLGRNNHFGSRSVRGTKVAAIFYSLIESAKLNDLDPAKYLRVGVQAALRNEQVSLPHEVVPKAA